MKSPYSFSAWLGDLVKSALGKFLVGIGILATIVTIVVATTGVWPQALFGLPLVAVISVFSAAYDVHRRLVHRFPGLQPRFEGHDYFLAAPMAGTASENEYQEILSTVEVIRQRLRIHTSLKTGYWAGDGIATKKDFDPEDHALSENFNYLLRSRILVFLYPRQMFSSVLVEFGFAYAHRIPTIIFVRNRTDLPYVIREVSQAAPWIQIYEAKDQDFVRFIENTIIRHVDRRLVELEKAARGR